MDIGYAGCTRKAALEKFSAGMAQSQPDVTFYDWEGWTDMEVSTATACHHAVVRRRPLLPTALGPQRPSFGKRAAPKTRWRVAGAARLSDGQELAGRDDGRHAYSLP